MQERPVPVPILVCVCVYYCRSHLHGVHFLYKLFVACPPDSSEQVGKNKHSGSYMVMWYSLSFP